MENHCYYCQDHLNTTGEETILLLLRRSNACSGCCCWLLLREGFVCSHTLQVGSHFQLGLVLEKAYWDSVRYEYNWSVYRSDLWWWEQAVQLLVEKKITALILHDRKGMDLPIEAMADSGGLIFLVSQQGEPLAICTTRASSILLYFTLSLYYYHYVSLLICFCVSLCSGVWSLQDEAWRGSFRAREHNARLNNYKCPSNIDARVNSAHGQRPEWILRKSTCKYLCAKSEWRRSDDGGIA